MTIWALAARADFGFGNPNLAGAFFAMLAVGVWGFCGGEKSDGRAEARGFWICLAASAAFAALMVGTASRGAAAALGAGVAAAWWAAGFPRIGGRRLAATIAAGTGVVALAVGGRMGERVGASSPEDGSITSRLAIYGAVPAMMAAAPGGWGRENAAEAYQNWFQAKEDTRIYKHLVSTHGTWMVERFGSGMVY